MQSITKKLQYNVTNNVKQISINGLIMGTNADTNFQMFIIWPVYDGPSVVIRPYIYAFIAYLIYTLK